MARGRFAADPAPRRGPGRRSVAASEDRRDEILEAAIEVICREGFGETRIAHVAEHAGVSGGTVIYHFGTLDNLLVEALRRAESAFYETAERAVAEATTPRERLERFVSWVFAKEEGNERLWRLWIETWSHADRHEEVATTRAEQDERWRAMLTEIALPVSQGVAEAERFAIGFGAFMDGLTVQLALKDRRVSPGDAVALAMEVADRTLGW